MDIIQSIIGWFPQWFWFIYWPACFVFGCYMTLIGTLIGNKLDDPITALIGVILFTIGAPFFILVIVIATVGDKIAANREDKKMERWLNEQD